MPVTDKDVIALDILASGKANPDQSKQLMALGNFTEDDVTAWSLTKTQPKEIADDLRTKVLDKVRTRKQNQVDDATKATVKGALQGVTFGFADEIESGLRAGVDRILRGEDFGAKYEKYLKKEREDLKRLEEKHPIPFIASELAASAIIPIPGTLGIKGGMKAQQILKKFGVLAFESALGSAGKSEAEFGSKQFIEDLAKGTAFGIGGGVIAGKAVKKAGELAQKVEGPISKASQVVSAILFDLPPKYTEKLLDSSTAQKILNPKSSEEIVQSVVSLTKNMGEHATALSKRARNQLSSKNDIDIFQDIMPEIRKMDTYRKSMTGQMSKAKAAKSAGAESMEDLGARATKQGMISEKNLKSYIQAIDEEIPWNKNDWEFKDRLLGEIRGTIDSFLKTRNTNYRESMKPVDRLMSNLSDISKSFSLKRKGYGVEPTDATFSKVKSFFDVAGESKKPVTEKALQKAREFFPDKNILEDIELSQIARRTEGGQPAGSRNLLFGLSLGALLGAPTFGAVAGAVKDKFGRKVGKTLLPHLTDLVTRGDKAIIEAFQKLSPEAIEALSLAARESGRVIGVRSSMEDRSILPSQQSILPRR